MSSLDNGNHTLDIAGMALATSLLNNGVESVNAMIKDFQSNKFPSKDFTHDFPCGECLSQETSAILIVGHALIQQLTFTEIKKNEQQDALVDAIRDLTTHMADLIDSVDGYGTKPRLANKEKVTVLTKEQVYVALVEAWEKLNHNYSHDEACSAMREFRSLMSVVR